MTGTVDEATTAAPAPASTLRSVHSTNLPAILLQLGITLMISTYQAGRLVIVRAESERALNTHFFGFSSPMGLAVDGHRLLVGTRCAIDEFRNVPALCQRLEPADRYDAAYVWRNTHVTGAIDIHEMATGADGRWYFVNTAFSCLCVMDHDHSFVPVWRPRFVSGYAPRRPLSPERPGDGRGQAALADNAGRDGPAPGLA